MHGVSLRKEAHPARSNSMRPSVISDPASVGAARRLLAQLPRTPHVDEHEVSSDENIEFLAGDLPERVRSLNRLAQGLPGLTEPAAAYTILGNLAQASYELAETAEQIDAFLTRELESGRLGHDRGEDPVAAVTTAHDVLGWAAEQSAELGDSFRRAASALAPIHGRMPGNSRRPSRMWWRS